MIINSREGLSRNKTSNFSELNSRKHFSGSTIILGCPQYGWHFPEEIAEKFRKDPGNALRAFPGIPVESTAGMPQTLSFKAFEASRAFPEFSPPQYGWGRFFFSKWFRRGPPRAGYGIPSSTGSISEILVPTASPSFVRSVCIPTAAHVRYLWSGNIW